MAGIFITATGTDIGKTYLLCRLLRWDNAHQRVFTASKPVISGWPHQPEEINKTDTALLLEASCQPITSETINHLSPWRFHPALTPDMAARMEGKDIHPSALVSYCQQQIKNANQSAKTVLIEGAGGVMSPISSHFTVLDWVAALACPCILVTGSYLGTLSHTLTAVEVLRMKKVDILAIIVNETPDSTVYLEETCASLRSFLSYPVIDYPHMKQPEMTSPAIDLLYQHLLQHISQLQPVL